MASGDIKVFGCTCLFAMLLLIDLAQEMSELLGKQVNAQKESLIKKLLGFMQANKKCAMKMKVERKNRQMPKIFLMEGSL